MFSPKISRDCQRHRAKGCCESALQIESMRVLWLHFNSSQEEGYAGKTKREKKEKLN